MQDSGMKGPGGLLGKATGYIVDLLLWVDGPSGVSLPTSSTVCLPVFGVSGLRQPAVRRTERIPIGLVAEAP
jgi:hypothetical protein